WGLAGGHVTTNALKLDTGNLEIDGFTLRADALSLEELMAGILQSGFKATGSVSGQIPVTLKSGTPSVHHATLKAANGGVINYVPPADAPVQKGQAIHTDILLGALENFHYTDLSLSLNSDSAEKVTIGLHVKG